MSSGEISRFTANQRSEVRYRVEQPAILRVPSVVGGIYIVTILDVSKSGLRVGSPAAFKEKTQVEIQFANLKVGGEIRYAREVESGQYHLGIQVITGHESVLLRKLNLPLGD